MNLGENIGVGIMIMGLVLGAITGDIAMLLIPAAAGAIIATIANCYHKRSTISFSNKYPPYGY